MILSDNETKLDLLNNQAIAKTIVSIIKESKESISIGVHGDWGAGKSSILAMVENLLSPKRSEYDADPEDSYEDEFDWDEWDEEDPEGAAEDDTGLPVSGCITVRFNSWQYQGFEDAKIALMSAIVKTLQKETKSFYKEYPVKGAFKKIKETCKRIWGNLDKLSLAKSTAKIGVSVATGTTPLALFSIGAQQAKKILIDEKERDEFISTAGALLKGTASETSNYKEMADFRANYKELFKAAHIEKLVVLIDDLDRCLPKVAIETLEVVKMLLSMENTAFIIAADDEMIRYSVKEYFPRVLEKQKNRKDDSSEIDFFREFSEKYLEKLIQVPLHIPIIGIREAQLYILLLLIEAEIGETDSFKNLVKVILNKLHKPWSLEPMSPEEIREALGEDDYDKASKNIRIAKSIDRILAENTSGNPRNIKRFVNMLLLRTEVAHNRGFEDLQMAVLAKMMLAEQYNDELYKAIADELRDDGTCPAFDVMENKDDQEEKVYSEANTPDDEKKTTTKCRSTSKEVIVLKPTVKNDRFAKLLGEPKTKAWMDDVEPSLAGVDLRPYYFACKESDDFFFSNPDEMLRELCSVIRGGSMNVSNNSKRIKGLEDGDARKLFREVTQDAFTRDITKQEPPKVIEGIRRFVEFRNELQDALGDFLLTLPTHNIGMWALGDWDSCLPKTCSARTKYLQFIHKIGETNSNPIIKAKVKQIQE